MDTQIFKEIGFTEGEINVYLSLFELGETTTGPLIKKSRVSGSKVYEILEKLIQKGLVSYITKEKTKYFQISSPSRILDYVDKKEKDLARQKEEVEKILPELEKRKNLQKQESESFVLEGLGGIKTFFKMILDEMKKGEEYYVFSLGDDLGDKNIQLFLQQHHMKRGMKGVKIKLLLRSDDKKYLGPWKFKGMKLKYLKSPFPVGTFIFKDYVANVKFSPMPIVFVMKSKEISKSYRDYFLDVWEKAKD